MGKCYDEKSRLSLQNIESQLSSQIHRWQQIENQIQSQSTRMLNIEQKNEPSEQYETKYHTSAVAGV